MMPLNNFDNLSIVKLLIILKIFQQSYCYESINKHSKKVSSNINCKNNTNLNSITVKKNKVTASSILPIQEVNLEDLTEHILPKEELNIKNETIDIIKRDDTSNNAYNFINEIHEKINTNHVENFISALPIVVAEKNIDIPIESIFKLKNAALEVKNMKKEVYLTNSKLLPMYENQDTFSTFHGKLFLEGFIRNKLDFSIAKSVNNSIINLDTESVIIYIPFKFTTLIPYKIPPIFFKSKDLSYIPIYMSSDCLDVHNEYLDYANKKNTVCEEYINCDIPPINCEINEIKINETYTLVDRSPFNSDFPIEMNFNTIKENIVINLSLTLLQKQDVAIKYNDTPK